MDGMKNLGGTLALAILASSLVACAPAPPADAGIDQAARALGQVWDQFPEEGQLRPMSSQAVDAPPSSALDPSALMEMVQALSGRDASRASGDNPDRVPEEDIAAAIAALSELQPSDNDGQAQVPADADRGDALMAGLGGIPVKTGSVTREILFERLLTPSGEE